GPALTERETEPAASARRETQQRIEHATETLAALRRDADLESEALNQQRAEAAAAAERRRATSSDLRRLEAEREDVASRSARHRLELTEATTRIEELRSLITGIDRLAGSLDEGKGRQEGQNWE